MGWRGWVATGAVVAASACGDVRLWQLGNGDAGTPPPPNAVQRENALPGDPLWSDGVRSRQHEVELYLSTDSAEAGEEVGIKLSSDVPSEVTLQLYRLGHYGGDGARRAWSSGSLVVTSQRACGADPATRRISCDWDDTASLRVDPAWLSGLYVLKAVRSDGFFRFSPLVIRDARRAELLFGAGVNTYQAYNAWGGASLYEDGSGTMPSGRAHEVSFDRPYDGDEGAGQQLRYESHLARFLERHGYDVTYASNLDFVRGKAGLGRVHAFVHGGHDEYWNPEQRAQVDAALASGHLSLLHFGGNGAYWRTRAVPSADGRLRTLACYKSEPHADPLPGSTLRYRDPGVDHPESLLFGAMYDGWQTTPFPLVVRDEQHWLFEGTSLSRGEMLHGLVGYEFDRVFPGLPAPRGISLPFESPVLTAEGIPSWAHAVSADLPGGNRVFSAGTIYWPLGLTEAAALADPRVDRMTLNALEWALSRHRPARALEPVTGAVPTLPAPDPRWARAVKIVAGHTGVWGDTDGPADRATFRGPTALALLPDGSVVVADTVGNRVRRIGTDAAHTVSTLAGNGRLGHRDGPGNDAMFRAPIGLAVLADGSILVADSDNHVLRRLVQGQGGEYRVETWAGMSRMAGFADGPSSHARFDRPTALALDPAGNVLVADQAGHRIRRVSGDGSTVTTVAGGIPGDADAGDGRAARFNNPSALAVGKGGEIFVFDSGNQALRRIDPRPPHAVVTLAGRKDGQITGYWQQGRSFGFADGTGSSARFLAQMGLAVDGAGALLLADAGNARVRKIIPGTDAVSTQVFTLAGSGRVGVRTGAADQSDLTTPAGLVVTQDDRVFVTDPYHGRILEIVR